MTLDARTLVAIAEKGPGYELTIDRIARDENPRVCATALAEAAILLRARGDDLAEMTVRAIVDHLEVTVVPFTERDWIDASQEHKRLCEESGIRPSLGHCLSAAIAAKTGAPLIDV